MSLVQIYDRALCCSTGVCGPQVDPVLPQFASDLEWLKSAGHQVERFNLAQEPMAFAQNAEVQTLLKNEGVECLPLVFVDGKLQSRANYPTRSNLALWTSTPIATDSTGATGCCGTSTPALLQMASPKAILPLAISGECCSSDEQSNNGCCGDTGCC